MNTVLLGEVNFKDESSTREFIDLNALDHETIFNTLLGVLQLPIAHYPLDTDTITPDWLMIHGQEHKGIASALGLPTPVDLGSLDTENAESTFDWIENHALAHAQIVARLGL